MRRSRRRLSACARVTATRSLLDGHSIRSEVPRFFAGRLPDSNLGTANGASCRPALQAAVARVLGYAEGFTHVVNGRFKGGWITRHYGQPPAGVHALQLEMAQICYMDEAPPYPWDPRERRSDSPGCCNNSCAR